MKRRNGKHSGLSISASLAFLALAASPASAADITAHQPSASRPQGDSRTAAFAAALEADGFIVQQSHDELVDPFQVLNEWRFMDSCAGNNAGQPYKRWIVPPPPGWPEVDLPFHLAQDEAVVYVGTTPPQCDYFSFVPMLWSRQYSDSCKLTGDFLFASVGDPLNNMWIQTEVPDAAFGQNTIVVLTADQGVYERIVDSACRASFPARMVNLLVLPAEVLRLGVEPGSDRFMVLERTANFAKANEGRKYLADNSGAKVFRVTPRAAPLPRLYDQPAWRNRACINEETLVPGLTDGLRRLEAGILEKTRYVQARPLGSMRWFYDSSEVLDPNKEAYRKYVAGESSDTPYLRSAENGVPANFLLGHEDMVVVYGANHAATGLATYSMFGVYGDWTLSHCPLAPGEPLFAYGANDPIWNGVAGMNNHEFAGSAAEYLPRNDPMAPYLYAVRVVRHRDVAKGDKYCVVVPGTNPDKDSEYGPPFYPDIIGLESPAFIGYRAYLNPATGAGPAYEDILPDRAIWFKLQ